MDFTKCRRVRGEINIPGDKSISHRAVMFGALAEGTTEVSHFLKSADCLSTISCFRKMGIEIENGGGILRIQVNVLHGLIAPQVILNAGNSGTTTRLISGILAGQPFTSRLTGDASVCRRPMDRIITPLTEMGAAIYSDQGNGCAPLTLHGRPLKGIHYHSPVASAQVKSCVLLAGLYADTPVSVTEPALSRNHTELMLTSFGASVTSKGNTATILPDPSLTGQRVDVPGDISSAAFFIAAALLVPGSELLIRHVGVNPTRDGFLRVIEAMGGSVEKLNVSTQAGEPTADLLIRSSSLHGTVIEGAMIPTLIDEIPILAVLAAYAEGKTVIRDAAELKVKESNRLDIMVRSLAAMGADITGTEDGMVIRGGNPLHGAVIDSHLDHRIAMAFAIAALAADGITAVDQAECVDISYPGFYDDLQKVTEP